MRNYLIEPKIFIFLILYQFFLFLSREEMLFHVLLTFIVESVCFTLPCSIFHTLNSGIRDHI